MLNVKGIRPSSLESAVFFTGACPGMVTVAVTGREAAGEPSTEVTDAYWKKCFSVTLRKWLGLKTAHKPESITFINSEDTKPYTLVLENWGFGRMGSN